LTSPKHTVPLHIALTAIAAIPVRAFPLFIFGIHPYINLRRKASSFHHIISQYRVTVKSALRFIGAWIDKLVGVVNASNSF